MVPDRDRRTTPHDARSPTSEADRARHPTAEHPLLIQAMDHRDSLQRDLYGIPGTPTPQQAARIAGDKLLVFEGLLEAMADLSDDATPGVLVDEEHGASVAALAGRTDGVDLCVPVEASGHPWFTFAFPEDWRTHETVFGNQHVKVLVRDNPGLDAAARARQAADLAPVSAAVRRHADHRRTGSRAGSCSGSQWSASRFRYGRGRGGAGWWC